MNGTRHPRPSARVSGRKRGSEARNERACMRAGILAFPAEGILTRQSQQRLFKQGLFFFLWRLALTLLLLLLMYKHLGFTCKKLYTEVLIIVFLIWEIWSV